MPFNSNNNWTQSQTTPGLGGQQWGSFLQDFQALGISDPTNLSNVQGALSQVLGREIPKGMISSLSPGMLKGMQFSTYEPMLEQKTSSLLSDLTKSLEGKTAAKAYGGFASSSRAGQQEQLAKDVYGEKAGKVLHSITEMQAGARRSISDIVNQWRMAGQAIK